MLSADLADRLRAMVGLRNRLVHLYEEVDDVLVARAVHDDLDDWDAFARAVAGLLADPDTVASDTRPVSPSDADAPTGAAEEGGG